MTGLDILWVGLGGGLGSLLRWWIGHLAAMRYRGNFPLGTFLINTSGAFLIGYLSTLFMVDWNDRYGTPLNSGILTGILGGYTTFSTMQLDAVTLAEKSRGWSAMLYLLLSTAAGLAAAWLGVALALMHR